MNEESQLKAIELHLTASGYSVYRDIADERLAEFGIDLRGMALDFLAVPRDLPFRGDWPVFWPGKPPFLIVEVANRERRLLESDGQDGRPASRQLYDGEALQRFERISKAIETTPALFEIRFLDVSAEQAAAREIHTPVKSKQMGECLQEHQSLLARSSSRDRLSHSLVVARLWAFWLRVTGNRFPGHESREMKDVDLRVLQKDLFDSGVVKMDPVRYRKVHRSLMAIHEGGEFNTIDVSDLERELWLLLRQASDWYHIEVQVPTDGDAFDDIYKQIRAQLDAHELLDGSDSGAIDAAKEILALLAIRRGSAQFAREVAAFQLAVRHKRLVSEDLIQGLLEEAAKIPESG